MKYVVNEWDLSAASTVDAFEEALAHALSAALKNPQDDLAVEDALDTITEGIKTTMRRMERD